MVRMGPVLWFLVLSSAAYGASRTLPLGDARRGREVFRARQCVLCHSINGEGGKSAPDLGRSLGRVFAPYRLAGHALGPRSGDVGRHAEARLAGPRSQRTGRGRPVRVSLRRTVYRAARGRRAGASRVPGKSVRFCHGLTQPARPGIRPVAEWPALEDELDLASARLESRSRNAVPHWTPRSFPIRVFPPRN